MLETSNAGQDEVCLGPESGRLPDGDERKAVAAQVDYGHSGENGSSHEHCCWRISSQTSWDTCRRCDVDVDVDADVDIWQLGRGIIQWRRHFCVLWHRVQHSLEALAAAATTLTTAMI